MRARDIMTSPVFTVAPRTPLVEVVNLMLDRRISAVPVVDDGGMLLGIVSEGDLLRRKELGIAPEQSWWLKALGAKAALADEFVRAHATRAEEVMTEDVHAIGEDTPLPDIAKLLERNRIKRVPVVSNGRVTGIVSRANLLQALSVNPANTVPHPTDTDRVIRARVLEHFARNNAMDISHLNLVVQDAKVFLWGSLASVADRDALIDQAGRVPGVADVVDNTQVSEAKR